MCEALQEAKALATNNIDVIAKMIDNLPIPCAFKGVFMRMADTRGFRFDDETIRQMEEIGKTESDICLMLLEGKDAGLITVYVLSTELDDDKQRAEAISFIREYSKKKTITEKDIWKAVTSVVKGAGGLFNERTNQTLK